jgi:hypothetical protein
MKVDDYNIINYHLLKVMELYKYRDIYENGNN